MAAREYQDLAGGYINETTADQTAGRVFQDLSGGYIVVAESGGGGATAWGGANAANWCRIVVNRD